MTDLRRTVSGALSLWGMRGEVTGTEDIALTVRAGETVLIISRVSPGRWRVATASGSTLGTVRGVHGLLRALRSDLQPWYRPSRMIVAATPTSGIGADV